MKATVKDGQIVLFICGCAFALTEIDAQRLERDLKTCLASLPASRTLSEHSSLVQGNSNVK